MKLLLLLAVVASGFVLTGCETTVVHDRPGYRRSHGYYDESPRRVYYSDGRRRDWDGDRSRSYDRRGSYDRDRSYDRNVRRTNVYEQNVYRTNVQQRNVSRVNATPYAQRQTVSRRVVNRDGRAATVRRTTVRTPDGEVRRKKVKIQDEE